MAINPFYWHKDKKGYWRFGDYWVTDIVGGFIHTLGFIFIGFLPFWIGVIVGIIIGIWWR